MYIISRHIAGITLNPKEQLLDEEGNIKKFDTPRQARDFLVNNGMREEGIGYSVFIGTEENNDMFTYRTPKYFDEITKAKE